MFSRSGVSTGPGTERVHAHALARELHAELAAHRQHGPLRRRVGDLRGGRAEDRHEARDVDHRATAPLEQVGDPVLAAEEDAARVDRLHAVPGLDRRVEHRGVVVGRDAGVVVEDVDAAEALRGLRATSLRTSSSSATFTLTANASPEQSPTVSSAASRFMSAAHTFAPSSVKRIAASRPMPPPAPVITQTFPSSPLHQPSVDRNTFLTSE